MQFRTEKEIYSTIGKNIKFYRMQKKLTQVQLAEEAQISVSYLSKIEAANCEKSISIAMLQQIANALAIDITLFFKP